MNEEGQEAQVEEEIEQQSGINVGLTQWGFIGVNVQDANGDNAGHVIKSPDEAWALIGHLSALATMMIERLYSQAIAEKQLAHEIVSNPQIYIPGK